MTCPYGTVQMLLTILECTCVSNCMEGPMSEGWAVRASVAGAPPLQSCSWCRLQQCYGLNRCTCCLLWDFVRTGEKLAAASWSVRFCHGEHVFRGCEPGPAQCPKGHLTTYVAVHVQNYIPTDSCLLLHLRCSLPRSDSLALQ